MDWRAALRDRLVSDPAVAALVAGRVYIGQRPQATALPAIVLVVVSDDRPALLRSEDYPPGRVQVDCFAPDSKKSWDLAEAALAAVTPAMVWQGHQFARASLDLGMRDLSEVAGSATVFRVTFDAIFYHSPA